MYFFVSLSVQYLAHINLINKTGGFLKATTGISVGLNPPDEVVVS